MNHPLRLAAILTFLAGTVALGQQAVPAGYHVAARRPLAIAANGVDGELQLLEDSRITPALKKKLWRTGELVGDSAHEFPGFTPQRPRNAILRIITTSGVEQDKHTLERPLARLEDAHLYAAPRLTYLLTVDYSAGFGSYNGPITSAWEITDAHLHRLEAQNRTTGEKGDISLMDSLKTVWKIVPGASGGKEILLAMCRPKDWGAQDVVFVTTYARFYFKDERWMEVDRVVEELNEFDDGFPKLSMFPK